MIVMVDTGDGIQKLPVWKYLLVYNRKLGKIREIGGNEGEVINPKLCIRSYRKERTTCLTWDKIGGSAVYPSY